MGWREENKKSVKKMGVIIFLSKLKNTHFCCIKLYHLHTFFPTFFDRNFIIPLTYFSLLVSKNVTNAFSVLSVCQVSRESLLKLYAS